MSLPSNLFTQTHLAGNDYYKRTTQRQMEVTVQITAAP